MISSVMPTYARADLAFERGEGAYIWSTQGQRYLDFGSGVAVTALGHCHPKLVAALQAQAAQLWHCSNLYQVPGQDAVSRRLVEHSFADTVFFCNSGAEANECAIKMARKFHHDSGAPERHRIICATGAFHGRTLATLAAGGQEKHLHGFAPVVEGFDHVPYGNLNALRDAIGPNTAAIMVETILGEGGVIPGDPDYLRRLRATADEFGLLLIFDEVQTGMGRTGTLFSHQQSGVTPDIMSLAKGLGGGFPVGACAATERAAKGMTAGTHGSTFGGNPLAMSAAQAVLDVMLEPGFLEGVRHRAQLLRQGLETVCARHPKVIAEVRGTGMMLGLKCVIPNTELQAKLREHGLLTVGAGDNVVRLLPPLIIGQAEIDLGLSILETSLAELGS